MSNKCRENVPAALFYFIHDVSFVALKVVSQTGSTAQRKNMRRSQDHGRYSEDRAVPQFVMRRAACCTDRSPQLTYSNVRDLLDGESAKAHSWKRASWATSLDLE